MLRVCSFFVLSLMLAAPPVAASAVGLVLTGQARVIDGDTIDVAGERIRLHGIDAPEMRQTCDAPDGEWACGEWARDEMVRLIDGRALHCTGVERDRYGRLVAACMAGSADLGAALVEAGVAVAYERYSLAYVPHEHRARAARRGLWAQGGAGVARPSQWRRGQAEQGAAPVGGPSGLRFAAGECDIKGNISAHGHIYHLPGQRDYDRTVIDTARGERWFCTENEARAAGWRRAQR